LPTTPRRWRGVEERHDGLIAEKLRPIERLRALEDAEGRGLLSEVSDGVDRYLEPGDRILAETRRNSARRALELSRGPGAEALSAMRDQIDALVEHSLDKMETAAADTTAANALTQTKLLAIAGAALVIGLAATVAIARSIGRSLDRALAVAGAVAGSAGLRPAPARATCHPAARWRSAPRAAHAARRGRFREGWAWIPPDPPFPPDPPSGGRSYRMTYSAVGFSHGRIFPPDR